MDYTPTSLEENVLEIIGLLQNGKSDKTISAKEIALTLYGDTYVSPILISIHNILRKLKFKGLVRSEATIAPTRENKIGWVLEGSAIKYFLK